MNNKETSCKTDPRAPHGFLRNASHAEDRYVCECEFWEPPECKKEIVRRWAIENGEWHPSWAQCNALLRELGIDV